MLMVYCCLMGSLIDMRKALRRDKDGTTIISPYDKPIHVSKISMTLWNVCYKQNTFCRNVSNISSMITMLFLILTIPIENRIYNSEWDILHKVFNCFSSSTYRIGFTLCIILLICWTPLRELIHSPLAEIQGQIYTSLKAILVPKIAIPSWFNDGSNYLSAIYMNTSMYLYERGD